MEYHQLVENIRAKNSFLCIGLDTDKSKIPSHLLSFEDPVFEFNKQIIDATHEYCVAYKPNIAFYESLGAAGWQSLNKTLQYIPENIFTIADAKRGDIGNTSSMYARAFFDPQAGGMSFDAVTVAPYMGSDSVKPFLEYKNKWVILLALTSNAGSTDFQTMNENGEMLFERVIRISKQWGTCEQMMYVAGATHAAEINRIRKLVPEHFLLVPGVGAQGGSLKEVARYGLNKNCGLLVNNSRNIIYASDGKNFADAARYESQQVSRQMASLLS